MYAKIYAISATGDVALHVLRAETKYAHSWEGATEPDGTWVGVVYPAMAQCRDFLASLPGITLLPSHLHDENVATDDNLSKLPDRVGKTLKDKKNKGGPVTGREVAKELYAQYGHPALHPDT
jgi:hypothetical protein